MSREAIKINGSWTEGYAVDVHTTSSEYLYHDENDRPVFDTTRSKLGELLYKFKYHQNRNLVYDIINSIHPFVSNWISTLKVDCIIAMPPSNKNRTFQPVHVIAEELSKTLSIPYAEGFLAKQTTTESKNLDAKEAISNSMIRKLVFNKKVNVLLIDDLYMSGASMNEAVRVLREDNNVNNIYVLALTKTRRSY